MQYLFVLNFFLWSSSLGIIEAILFSKKATDAFKFNEHVIFTIQRLLTGTMVLIATTFVYDLKELSLLFLSCALCFPFFHDGSYYESRRRIDVPTYNFFSNSTSSTAKIELSLVKRIILLITGLIIFILLNT